MKLQNMAWDDDRSTDALYPSTATRSPTINCNRYIASFPARDTSRGIIASTRKHSGTAAITPTACVAGAFVEQTVGDNRCGHGMRTGHRSTYLKDQDQPDVPGPLIIKARPRAICAIEAQHHSLPAAWRCGLIPQNIRFRPRSLALLLPDYVLRIIGCGHALSLCAHVR